MPINGVKWRFWGLNEKRCKRTYYIYIYRKSHFLKSDQKPQGGKPSLKPSRSLRSPLLDREKQKKHFPEYEMLFPLITGFSDTA